MKKTITSSYLAEMNVDVFSEVEVVFDCLKLEDSRIILPSMGQIRVQAKLILGAKQIIKELKIELEKVEMGENEMLRIMVRDLQEQIKELKKGQKFSKNKY